MPLTFKADKAGISRSARRAVAVARMFGAPLRVSYAELRAGIERVKVSQKALYTLANSLNRIAIAVASLFLVGATARSPTLDPEYVLVTVVGISFFFAGVVALKVADRESDTWIAREKDGPAFVACVNALSACGRCAQGRTGILEVEWHVAELARELGAFASNGGRFSNVGRKQDMSRHVAQVQKELLMMTGKLLEEGPAALSDVVERLAMVLDRMWEQRWLRLLDGLDCNEDESVSTTEREPQDKRDAWIVLGGALAAAIGLAVSGSAGVPLSAAVPAALVLMLGPATLWGSRRLGSSPSGLLQAMSGAFDGAASAGGANPTQAPPSQGSQGGTS
ncbi:hypothetical protein ABZX78_00375 [Streptomyces cellulosae]